MNETSSSRFGSFFDRVQTERAALKIVNEKFSGGTLNGLTEAAINSWVAITKGVEAGNSNNIDAISSILRRLSSRIDALADQSRTVFSNERFPVLPSDEILHELDQACRQQDRMR